MFNRGPAIPTVEVEQLPTDGYLLDVREVDEWDCGHAPHAVHLPMSELMARIDEVPADREIYVICKVGGRSAQVVGYLNAQGRETVNVAGGMLAWAAAGRPLVGQGGGDAFVA
ncbi:rhodanese-like domain-containing protein [Actinospica sp.]|jgi:rhodanese-related sulfurtransferase|uniref:rhodanese-like domain-containing protein n=1 Tax=Actinospica sp. TaxID=1872142 RepID=UPI002C819387|nr:rhodanese-like domain-containing protein [Actinospica sp.]HWG24010.1 rhodanese-like domain-containing protein [Actinospica sp.]